MAEKATWSPASALSSLWRANPDPLAGTYRAVPNEDGDGEDGVHGDGDLELQDMTTDAVSGSAPRRTRWLRYPLWLIPCAFVMLSFCALGVYFYPRSTESSSSTLPRPSQSYSHAAVAALLESQTQSLPLTRAHYSLQNHNRPPPPHFDKWFHFAQENNCPVNMYEQVFADFAPFYDLEDKQPGWFKERVQRLTRAEHTALKVVRIVNGVAFMEGRGIWLDEIWLRTLNRVSDLFYVLFPCFN